MKLTRKQIRSLCTDRSFERGLEYFHESRVLKLEQDENLIKAVVSGAHEYRVRIRVYARNVEASCTCPYDREGCCKHIVATLLAVSTRADELLREERERERRLGIALEKMSFDELKMFILNEIKRDTSLRDRFMIRFSDKGSDSMSLHDYKREIEHLYLEMGGPDDFIGYGKYVDFSPVFDLACQYERKGNFQESVTIYRALSEVIAENMIRLDDSDGYYANEFMAAVEGLASCLNGMRPSPEAKRPYIDYMFQKYMEGEPDYFREHYAWLLRETCHSEKELQHWLALLRPHLPQDLPEREDFSQYYSALDLLMMQLHIVASLNDRQTAHSLFQKYYRRDYEICLLYAEWLNQNDERKRAISVAEEGLTLFPANPAKKLRRFLRSTCQDQTLDKQKENLLALFTLDGEWEDYETLKGLCSEEEWSTLVPVIVERVKGENRAPAGLLMDVYLEEGMFDRALDHVLAQNSIASLARYHDHLASRYPDRYFHAYREMILPFADSDMGRRHYFEIVKHLKKMKAIPGYETETFKIAESLKQKYARRPAFQDELRTL